MNSHFTVDADGVPGHLDASGPYVLISREKGQAIAYGSGEVTQVFQTGMTREEVLANARLMVAAPELLEALLDLVCCPAFNGRLFETDKESHKAWTLARVVIAKAKGEANE